MRFIIYIFLFLTQIADIHAVHYRTFHQFIETGVYALSSFSPANYYILFTNYKSNFNYASAVSFEKLIHLYSTSGAYTRFSAILSLLPGGSKTGMTLNFSTALSPTQITALSVRYIVIQSSFPYLSLQQIVQDDTSSPITYTQTNKTSIQPTISTLNSNDEIVPFISGFDIKTKTTEDDYLSFQVFCTYNNASSISMDFRQNSITRNQNCYKFYLSVVVLVLHKDDFNLAYNYETFYSGSIDTTINDQVFSLPGHTLNNSLVFNGFDSFTKDQNGSVTDMKFAFSVSGSDVDVTIGNQQTIQFRTYYFITIPNCTNQSYWSIVENQCLYCKVNEFYNSINNRCELCYMIYLNCYSCNSTMCVTCQIPYIINSTNACQPNCSIFCLNCIIDPMNLLQSVCLICDTGYYPYNFNDCQPQCGDGYIRGTEQCDDANTANRDGCSSSCIVEDNFLCTGEPSTCMITTLDLTVIAATKSPTSNEISLALALKPAGLALYEQLDWSVGLQTLFSGALTKVKYEVQSNRLIVTFSYNEDLDSLTPVINASVSKLSPYLSNFSSIYLQVPQDTENNLGLRYYPDSVYAISKLIPFLSMAVAGLSLLLYLAGYFGSKLVGLQCVAVVQISSLLLLTLKNMGPTYDGLTNLSMALGISKLWHIYSYFQESDVPTFLRTQFPSRNNIDLFNASLAVLIVPFLLAIILKILSITAYKNNLLVEKAWKYTLGTYTFYGILFLAYGQLASLTINAKHFISSTNSTIGLAVGVSFAALFIIYLIFFNKCPVWFGCFKKNFFRFSISEYFYTISAIERIITTAIIVCLSPSYLASGLAGVFILLEIIIIAVKQPYILKRWVRPLTNKIITLIICLLFASASFIDKSSLINCLIPVVVLGLLFIVIIYSTVATVTAIKEHCRELQERLETHGHEIPSLSVEEGQMMLMKEFQKKIITGSISEELYLKPMQQQPATGCRWQKYSQLYSFPEHESTKKHHKPSKKLKNNLSLVIESDENQQPQEKHFDEI